MKKVEYKELFKANAIYKKIPKEKIISLYLDWKDESTYIGKGKILSIVDSKPIIFIDNPLIKNGSLYFEPKKCLCEIIESKEFEKGFKKHFIVPFKLTRKTANEILLKEERTFNKVSNSRLEFKSSVVSRALSYNNSLVDSIEEIELANEVNILFRSQSITGEKYIEIKERLNNNLEKRQLNIDKTFDRLYPEKAKRLKHAV